MWWSNYSHSFLKNQNLWINNLKFKQFFAIVCQIEGYQNILKLSCRSLAFTSCKAFSIKKRGLEIVSLTPFLHGF